jgi:hypothetical protein
MGTDPICSEDVDDVGFVDDVDNARDKAVLRKPQPLAAGR